MPHRPHCLNPGSCIAKGAGHCRKCHISAARKKAWADPAVRAKMSAARKKAWADPAVRAKMSAARKKALADPAVRAKMSAARKKAWADLNSWCPPELHDELRFLTNVLGRAAAVETIRRRLGIAEEQP